MSSNMMYFSLNIKSFETIGDYYFLVLYFKLCLEYLLILQPVF